MNTKITYKYRDANNYKVWGEEVIEGTLTLNQLTPCLIDTEFFIPKDIGLPDLQPYPRTEDDHDLHTIEELEETRESPTISLNAETLINNFPKARVGEWALSFRQN
ncbi:MAG: hypothetical protein KAR40_16735 [Candidatus Sabulitectum sp.]|nr:hypothetical protein [Candidatus Sabulitectum sp.]